MRANAIRSAEEENLTSVGVSVGTLTSLTQPRGTGSVFAQCYLGIVTSKRSGRRSYQQSYMDCLDDIQTALKPFKINLKPFKQFNLFKFNLFKRNLFHFF